MPNWYSDLLLILAAVFSIAAAFCGSVMMAGRFLIPWFRIWQTRRRWNKRPR